MLDRLLRTSMKRRAALLATTALVLPLGMIGPSPASSAAAPVDPCVPNAILENPCRPLLGAESNGYLPGATYPVRIAEHETRIGRPLDLVHIYVTSRPTMTDLEKSVASQPDKVALVNWKLSTSWAAAADGSLDSQIDAMGASLASIPHKVMLTVAHEAEAHISPGGGDPNCPTAPKTDSRGTVEDYVNMWHHVRERFDAAGVDNIVWVMDYMGYSKYFGCADALWPGNDYVDWVMWDPYPNGQSFTKTIGGFYDHLTSHSDAEHDYLSKPWGLAEWGYTGSSQTAAYAMYAEAQEALHANTFPQLKAYLIWDNLVAGGNDDRVGFDKDGNADPVEQAAYNAFASDPTFSPDSTPPTQVTALAADPVTATSAHLTWTPASDEVRVAGYRVYRDGSLLDEPAGDVTGYLDTGLVDGHSYHYDVRAVDPSGNESAPRSLSVSTPDTTAPTRPGSLVATPGKKQVTLRWQPSTDAAGVTGYRITRNGSPLTTTSTTSFTDTGLRELTGYTYSVVALDGYGNTSAAATQTARTLDSTAPKAPSGLRATVSGPSVRLTWTRPSDNVGVTSYTVYRGSTLVGTSRTTAFTDTRAPQGKKVSYRVRASDAAGNLSSYSTTVTATARDTTRPGNPVNLSATPGTRRITLTWRKATDNVAVTGYWLYRGTSRIKTFGASSVGYANTGLKARTTYTYRLVALDAAGNRSAGARVTAKAR